ncbi:hypothetical protein J3R82DRAFT_10296 [Butyriboletus roseoflavus]|nr:hypothetical protein J3R82DRAFT_10296 [Butyriboletus roseoflavus]
MSSFPGLYYWKKEISVVKQWDGTDHKQLQWVFVSALVSTTHHQEVLKASWALLDFIYLAQYQSHTDETLLHSSEIFVTLGHCTHFNLPKLYSLQHYVEMIKKLSSLNGLNTESSERLHIDYAKKAYAATNRKDYINQMTKWLQRQEAILWFKSFLAWHHGNQAEDLSIDSNSDYSGVDNHATGTTLGALQVPPVLQYCISCQPHFPKKSMQYLAQEHGTNNFIDVLEGFLVHMGLDH